MGSLHNELHRFTDVQSAYARAVGEIAPGFSGIERAGETLTPTMNLWDQPEWAYLRRERLQYGRATQGAVAGELSHVGIRVPAGQMLVVIESVDVGLAATGTLSFSTGSAVLTGGETASSGAQRDRRIIGTSRAQMVRGSQAALSGAAVHFVRLLADTMYRYPFAIVLEPGTTFWVVHDTANLGLTVSFTWRERSALPGELE